MATFYLAKSDLYGREDSITSSFDFIYKIWITSWAPRAMT